MFAELHTGTRAVLCTMYPSNAHSAGFVILPPQRIDNPIHISPKYETNCEAWYLFGCKFSVQTIERSSVILETPQNCLNFTQNVETFLELPEILKRHYILDQGIIAHLPVFVYLCELRSGRKERLGLPFVGEAEMRVNPKKALSRKFGPECTCVVRVRPRELRLFFPTCLEASSR